MFKVGDRVIVNVPSFNIVDVPATIVHIDNIALYEHQFSPVSVRLDRPYDEHGQTWFRVSLKEIKPLKEEL